MKGYYTFAQSHCMGCISAPADYNNQPQYLIGLQCMKAIASRLFIPEFHLG
jgi:hypothetical protein